MDVEARTFVDRGIIRSDSLWATARARITDYQLTDEWQDAGLMRVSLSATIAPLDSPQCRATTLPPLHLGAARLDTDPSLDPATVQPLMAGFDPSLRQDFSAAENDAFAAPG